MGDNYRNIGRLVAVHGLQGELVLLHRLGKKTSLKGLKVIFLEEKKDEMLPWFIQGSRVKGPEEILLKLEGLDTKEAARRVCQSGVSPVNSNVARNATAINAISGKSHESSTRASVRVPRTNDGRTSVMCKAPAPARAVTGMANQRCSISR